MRKILLLLAVVTCASADAGNPPAFSATATYKLDVPQMPLEKTLQQLAQVTGINVTYRSNDLRGTFGNALQGTLSVDAALRRTLFGSGLTYTLDRLSGDVEIVPLPRTTAGGDRLPLGAADPAAAGRTVSGVRPTAAGALPKAR